MKKFICSMMAAIVFLLSPISAYASTTESAIMYASSDEYSVMPLSFYQDDDTLNFSARISYGDYQLDNYSVYTNYYSAFNVPINERFNNVYSWPSQSINNTIMSENNYNSIKYDLEITSNSSDYLFDTILGIDSVFSGLQLGFGLYSGSDSLYMGFFNKPLKISYRCETIDGSRISSGSININDVELAPATIMTFPFYFEPNLSNKEIYKLRLTFYYDLPSDILNYNFDLISCHIAFANYNENYIFGDYVDSSTSLPSQDDYNKNVEAELGNIQTGINNVINSVVQMGNQAWEGAQQTVQAVTQMTEQLNSAIDQQRQDILEGLGLLGDDLDNSLNNVKTEITNIGSSITNKLESTTESITNKIESTTESITNTIETKVDEVTTAVDNVKESVIDVKNSILDLPNKIKDMLLGLIVPDAETMSSKFSEFSGLFEQKLGVIYQIPMMLFDFFHTIVNAATTPQTSLTLPAFTLPWIDGSTLTVWQPMEYRIIPEGMQVLSDLIKTITSMTVVVLTFNSVKRAYERFLRS